MSSHIPFRLAVLKALTTRLEEIMNGVGDFSYDLTDKIFRGISTYGESDPLPMLSILEDPREKESLYNTGESSARGTPWRLLVQGFVADDHVNPTDPAYQLSAETQKALASLRELDNKTLGFGSKTPCIMEMQIGAPIVRPPDEISVKAYFWLPVTLSIMENTENPFIEA